jgi:hypothetical protein
VRQTAINRIMALASEPRYAAAAAGARALADPNQAVRTQAGSSRSRHGQHAAGAGERVR